MPDACVLPRPGRQAGSRIIPRYRELLLARVFDVGLRSILPISDQCNMDEVQKLAEREGWGKEGVGGTTTCRAVVCLFLRCRGSLAYFERVPVMSPQQTNCTSQYISLSAHIQRYNDAVRCFQLMQKVFPTLELTTSYNILTTSLRGMMRTYTRQPQRVRADEDEAVPRKRIRMDERGIIREDPAPFTKPVLQHVPSSPPSSPVSKEAVFSSDPAREPSATPASSPPPRVASPPARPHKPVFSFLKRKRTRRSETASTSEPLNEIPVSSTNARKTQPPAKKARLTQMQIDLGGEIGRTCKGCGMSYIPSNAEDAGLHKEFHSMNTGGVDMGRGFSKDPAATVVNRFGEGEQVAMVEGKSALGIRNKVKKVLEVVNRELGAVDIADGDLWGKMPPLESDDHKKGERKRALRTGKPEEQEGRFRVFLYLAGDRCIGLCLAERIRSASKVVDSSGEKISNQENGAVARSSSILTETSQNLALLGISRIWTSKSHRRKGIASALLNCASNHFFYGIEVPKEFVAFSQPTESGGQLAEGWFGERTGWHVYAEN